MTPKAVVACVSRAVTQVVDRRLGDRVHYPLLVAAVCQEALQFFGIQSQLFYGAQAWVEVLEDQRLQWAGCWGEFFHFWLLTEFEEIVELNLSVAHRQASGPIRSVYSPPLLWSREVPTFCLFRPQGLAQLDLQAHSREEESYQGVRQEVLRFCEKVQATWKKAGPPEPGESDFPDEPLLYSGCQVLDDSRQSFRFFDRALSVQGLPPRPPFFNAV